MRIPIDGGHFCAGQGALSAVYLPYMSESATPSCGKMAPSLRVGPPMRPCCVAPRLWTNPNVVWATFSLPVRVHGKAPTRRCSTSTASGGNAVRGRAQASPQGAPPMARLGVAALAKGRTIACEPLLDPDHRWGSECRPYHVRVSRPTKPRSARLAWPHWRANAGHPHSVNRPWQR